MHYIKAKPISYQIYTELLCNLLLVCFKKSVLTYGPLLAQSLVVPSSKVPRLVKCCYLVSNCQSMIEQVFLHINVSVFKRWFCNYKPRPYSPWFHRRVALSEYMRSSIEPSSSCCIFVCKFLTFIQFNIHRSHHRAV